MLYTQVLINDNWSGSLMYDAGNPKQVLCDDPEAWGGEGGVTLYAYDWFMLTILNPPTHVPPYPIPLGHPSAPALSILYNASNLDQQFISHMIIYMFQCPSPKSSHPHPLPQSPKDCSIHLCLFCCLAYRVIVTIFLNSIYMCYYTVLVFLFLAYFTLYNRLQFQPPH